MLQDFLTISICSIFVISFVAFAALFIEGFIAYYFQSKYEAGLPKPKPSSAGAAGFNLSKATVRELRAYCTGNPAMKGYSKHVGSKSALVKFIEQRI